MTQGQYGIGLLGFWSLGETIEMRTAIPGQRPHRLVLHRDRPDYEIEPVRGRLALDERFTEVVVIGLHQEAQTALVGRRAADYLAAELRGQLLSRSVELIVEDRMSRGRAQKVIPVRPRRFLGERLEGIGPIEVPDYPPIRFEIYLSGSGEPAGSDEPAARLAIYSAGTLVAESFDDLAPLGLDRAPWTDPRLSGIVDFPAFRVAPGSRRGVVVDAASGAFARALALVEPILAGVLDAIERRRAEELDKTMVRDLQRAFRHFYKHRPRYALLPVSDDTPAQDGGGDGEGEGATAAPGTVPEAEVRDATRRRASIDLLPPGPLHAVRVTPDPLRVECRGTRRARAHALDATGRRVDGADGIDGGVAFEWSLTTDCGTLTPEGESGDRVLFTAGDREANGRLQVTARAADREARAEVEIEVLEQLGAGRGNEGIPEPELVHHPGATWRSRMHDGRWQVNTGHRDFRNVAERPVLKLRYLAGLFAKEVVLRSHQDPRLERPLEQLVEISSYADRQFTKRGKPGRRGKQR